MEKHAGSEILPSSDLERQSNHLGSGGLWQHYQTGWISVSHMEPEHIHSRVSSLSTMRLNCFNIFFDSDAEAKLFELYGLDHVSFTHDGRFEWLSKEISTETYCPLRESPDWPFETNECDLAMATDHATAPLKLASDAVVSNRLKFIVLS